MKLFLTKKITLLAIVALVSTPIASFFHVGVGVGAPYYYRPSYGVYTDLGWRHHRYYDDGGAVAAGSLLGFAAGTLVGASQRPVDPEEQAYLLEKRRMLREQREKDLEDLREEREQKRLEKKKQREEARAAKEQERLERKKQRENEHIEKTAPAA